MLDLPERREATGTGGARACTLAPRMAPASGMGSSVNASAGERRRLPIGIQTFREIREEGFYYVDKTAWIGRLIEAGKHYFLSRPRRFGKSLLVDTLKELFEGNEALFEGPAIHDRWDWSVRHPVLRLSFGGGNFKEPGQVHASAMAQLDDVQRETGVASEYPHSAGPLPQPALGPAPPNGPARRGAGGRVRQAHPGRARRAGNRPRQPRLPARPACTASSRTATRTSGSPSSPG